MVGVVIGELALCGPTPMICVDFELRVKGLWLHRAGSLLCCKAQHVRQKYLEEGTVNEELSR